MADVSSKRRILIAEGQNILADLIAEDREELGFQVLVAHNIAILEQTLVEQGETLDLIVADLGLPGGEVLELMKLKRPARVPFIVTSSQGNKQVVLESIRAGAFDFLEKPYSLGTELTPLIKRALSESELQQENSHLTEQVLHSSKLAALGELAATVLHDIRGPLSTIQMVSEDLQEELKIRDSLPKEDVERSLVQIGQACERINKLGNHLRDYARADAKETLEEVEAQELIHNATFMVQQKIRNLKIQFSSQVPSHLEKVKISCLPNKLEQVLMNLMSNACDAMETSAVRKLTVKLEADEEFVTFRVEDTGPGMSEETQQKIFETFFTTKPKGKGTGLGLKIVRGIIAEHGGELKVHSEIGKGSIFSVTLCQKLRILKQS